MDKINPAYQKAIKQLQKNLHVMSMAEFLKKEWYFKAEKIVKKEKGKNSTIPGKHSYTVATTPSIIKSFFNSSEFLSFISKILKKKAKSVTSKLFVFQWKDHTLLHDETKQKPGVDLILDFTTDWLEKTGGETIIVGKEVKVITPQQNTLSIIIRKQDEQSFIQYVNHKAGKRKRRVILGRINF